MRFSWIVGGSLISLGVGSFELFGLFGANKIKSGFGDLSFLEPLLWSLGFEPFWAKSGIVGFEDLSGSQMRFDWSVR